MADAASDIGSGLAADPGVRGVAAPEKPGRSRRRLVRTVLLGLGPLVLVVAAVWFYVSGGRWVSTDNAYIRAGMLNVTTDVSGLVASVEVRDNQRVDAGQVLFRLDREPFEIALRQAEAALGAVQNELSSLRSSYHQQGAEIGAAEAAVEYYQLEHGRFVNLAASNVAAKSQLDSARHNLVDAQQHLTALREQLKGIAASLGGDPDAPVERHSRYLQAKAAVDQARRNLDHTVVTASMPGIVAKVHALQPGGWLAAGDPAFALIGTDDLWIEANPKETDLTHVKTGDPVSIAVDTYPGREWHGRVTSISPASGAEFAVLPAQNTSGNWVKVVQRIPVRIAVTPDPTQPPLRAGMSVEVDIDTGQKRTLADILGGSAYGQDKPVKPAFDPSGLYAPAPASSDAARSEDLR